MTVRIRPQTEASFQRQVIALARLRGWMVAHFRPARTARGWRTAVQGDGKGFPDLVLVRPPRLVFAELKSERGKETAEQVLWMTSLRATGIEVYVWRPSQWEEIEEVLR